MRIAAALPNLITSLRLALVPVMGYLLLAGHYAGALIVFFIAAVSDLVDGFIARRFGVTSALGAALDPIADKLSMFVATVLLAWQGLVPLWLAIAVVLRDVVIVVGALAYRFSIGHIELKPTLLSKLNTVIEFTVLLIVMASAAEWIRTGAWLPAAFMVVFVTIVASGVHYVWLWGRKALREAKPR
jgi:cardiolipin synthase